jgi:tetratricopeptide (TPR) repeat protein
MMKARFSPEFLNRIDETVVYHPLSDDQIAQVLDVELNRYIAEQIAALKENRFQLDVDESAKQFILQQTIVNGGGVANLKRVLKNQLKSLIGVAVSGNRVKAGQTLHVSHKAGSPSLTFSVSGEPVKASPAPPPPPAVPAIFEWQRTSQSAEGWNLVEPREVVKSKELLKLAKSHLEQTGDYEMTEMIVRRSIDLLQDHAYSHPEHTSEALHFLGELLGKQGQHAEAVLAFNIAIGYLSDHVFADNVRASQKLTLIYADRDIAQKHIVKKYDHECKSDPRISVLLGQLGLSQQ